MMIDFLSLLKPKVIETDHDTLVIYRLGIFPDGIYEFACLEPGQYPPHIHEKSTSTIRVVKGSGVAFVGSDKVDYAPGTQILIPAGTSHGFTVNEATILLAQLDKPIFDPDSKTLDVFYPEK